MKVVHFLADTLNLKVMSRIVPDRFERDQSHSVGYHDLPFKIFIISAADPWTPQTTTP